MAEYIDRILLGEAVSHGMVHYEDIMSMPTADVVAREVLDQVYWERDTALHQLAEIGKGLGEKMDDVVERKHGKWTDISVYGIEDTSITDVQSAICSVCHKYHTTPYMYYFDNFNFCPNCGSDMRESEREE